MNDDTALADMDRQVADLAQRASKLTEDLTAAVGRASSPDGAVTVAVNANGILQKLELGNRASTYPPNRLAELIMATVARAQRGAAAQVTEAIATFGDSGGLVERFLSYQPPAEPEQPPPAAENDSFGMPAGDQAEPQPAQPAAVTPPAPVTPPVAAPAPASVPRPVRRARVDSDIEDEEERPW